MVLCGELLIVACLRFDHESAMVGSRRAFPGLKITKRPGSVPEPLRCGSFLSIEQKTPPHNQILQALGRACKDYKRRVDANAIDRQPCPYADCRSCRVWYWGYYERKEGSLPSDEDGELWGSVPIRRFMCTACRRTFSWRPPFLLFGRRFAAIAYLRLSSTYQQAWIDWALHRRLSPGKEWYELGQAAAKAFRRCLSRRLDELLVRLRRELHLKMDVPSTRKQPRHQLWRLAQRLVSRNPSESSRLSVHYVGIALARHPRAQYCLESC